MLAISREDVLARIVKENPWWESVQHFPFDSMKPRLYLDRLVAMTTSDVRRAIILMGPRRVGKTVLLHHALADLIVSGNVDPRSICLVSVDNPLYNNLSLQDFLDLYKKATGIDYESSRCFFIFDEIQYMRNWEQHLKVLVDSYPNLKFIASGSAAAALKLKSNESGAGRFTDLLLPPLTFYEYVRLRACEQLFDGCCAANGSAPWLRVVRVPDGDGMSRINETFLDYINFGGYPEVALNAAIQADPGRFVKSDIVDKVLLRDLPSLYGIENIQELNYLFTTLAYNTANEVSLENLSQNSGIAKNTIKRYIEYLEAAFLIKTVNRVGIDAKRFKRVVSFKVYLSNPSIRAALFAPLGMQDEKELGGLVETAVFAQWFHLPDLELYYARWRQGEVDMVGMDKAMKAAWATEVKWSDAYCGHPEKLKAQIGFCKKHGLARLRVTSKTFKGDIEHEGVSLEFVPASLYCYILGHNILNR